MLLSSSELNEQLLSLMKKFPNPDVSTYLLETYRGVIIKYPLHNMRNQARRILWQLVTVYLIQLAKHNGYGWNW